MAELADALDSGSSGLAPVGVRVPPFALILGLLLALSSGISCRSEGKRLVDELASTLCESVDKLESSGPADEKARTALEHLQSKAVRMRLLAFRLRDVVRTLNEQQRATLAAYAREKLRTIFTSSGHP